LLAAALALTFALVIALFFFRNLQARKNAEGRLAEAQHLDALGRLTGGVAHDMNNMLAIVTGNSWMPQRKVLRAPRTSPAGCSPTRGVKSWIPRLSTAGKL
jgi:C4-dicarboxylate-specific signal transduction histidine kinase